MATDPVEILNQRNAEVEQIRGFVDLTEEAKQRRIDEVNERARAEYEEAREANEWEIAQRVEQAERAVFKIPIPRSSTDAEEAQIRAAHRAAYESVYNAVTPALDSGDTESLTHAQEELERLRVRAERTGDEELARAVYHVATERGLRPWEIAEAVRPVGTKLRFVFDEAEVIDRDPSPPGPTATVWVEPKPQAQVWILRERYPDPPEDFAMSPDVEIMWTVYEIYLQGRDRLPSMAYTCLTRLTYDTGGNRREAARRYRISAKLLDKLGELSTSGDEATARKWVPGRLPRPLTDREVKWIEDAVKLLIYRVGQYASDPDREWPHITMAHLPKL